MLPSMLYSVIHGPFIVAAKTQRERDMWVQGLNDLKAKLQAEDPLAVP